MKHSIKYLLQKLLGFDNYLFVFSLFKIRTLRWDKNENQIFEFIHMLPDDGLILDIGANIGITTAVIAKSKPGTTIISYEPMPSNLKALRKIVSYLKLSNVTIKDHALGDQNGSVNMLMPVEGNVKLQGLSHVVKDPEQAKKNGIVVTAQVQTLDSISFESRISGIKIDVENFEFQVLKGAEKLLSTDKPVVYCELWDDAQRDKTITYMNALGYQTHALSEGLLKPYTSNLPDCGHNFFFLPV